MADQEDHSGHQHIDIDPNLLVRIVDAVHNAPLIENLFLMFVQNPPRFVLTNVTDDGEVNAIAAIPFSYALDISVGMIRGVQNVVTGAMVGQDRGEFYDTPNAESLSRYGPFKVL